MIIKEKWFDDMNLNDGATFLIALIKRAKYRFNQNNNFHVAQTDAYAKFQLTMVGTHRFSRCCVKNMMVHFF